MKITRIITIEIEFEENEIEKLKQDLDFIVNNTTLTKKNSPNFTIKLLEELTKDL